MTPAASAPARTNPLGYFIFFWLFLATYRFAAVLHYTLLSPLGERLLPIWLVGIAIGAEALLQMLLDVPAGHLVDRFGQKRMLGVGLVAFIISSLLFSNLSVTTYLASILLSVIGWVFLSPSTTSYLFAYAERGSSGRFLSLRDTFSSFGMALSSMALPLVLLFTPRLTGVTLAVLFGTAGLLLLASPRAKKYEHEEVSDTHHFHIRRSLFTKTLRAFARLNPASWTIAAYMFAGAVFYGTVWFTVPILIALDLRANLLGFGLAMFDLTIVALGFLIGSLVDRGDKRVLIFYGLLLFALTGMALGTTLGPLFLLLGFLATVGDETTNLSLWSWLHTLDKDHARDGTMAGAICLAEDLGYTVAPVLAGIIYSAYGPAWSIAAGALPLLVVWGAYAFFIRPIHSSSAPYPVPIPTMPTRRRHKSYR